jgi:hypothetical protein
LSENPAAPASGFKVRYAAAPTSGFKVRYAAASRQQPLLCAIFCEAKNAPKYKNNPDAIANYSVLIVNC